MGLQSAKAVVPELLVVRDPVPHRAESFGDEAVAALSAVPVLRHETGIEQDAEVLGDGWAAHLEMSRNRVDGAVGQGEEIEHPATRGMANCPKDIRLAIGSHDHAVNIRKQTLTCQVRSGFCRLGGAGSGMGRCTRLACELEASFSTIDGAYYLGNH